jgi:antirestriction protein ArdC
MAKPIDIVTNKIIEQLEKGVIPWNMPWEGGGPPMRVSVKKPYRGTNAMVLNIITMEKNYSNNYYGTYKQWQALGNQVKRGEKSCPVIYWKFFDATDDLVEDEDGKLRTRPPIARYYSVFNLDQTEGDWEVPGADHEFNPIKKAEEIVKNMPNRPAIMHGALGAYYRVSTDTVTVPAPERFGQTEEYYNTLFHELVHSTGHKSRLNRFSDEEQISMGNEYSKEELVAEIGASTLCNIAGIDQPMIKNASAYIAHWLKHLNDNRQFLVSAASKAQSAVEYINGATNEPDDNV